MQSITLRFDNNDQVQIRSDEVTIIVGPNNSGKSYILREIDQLSNANVGSLKSAAVSEIKVKWPAPENAVAEALKYRITSEDRDDDIIELGVARPSGGLTQTRVSKKALETLCYEGASDLRWWKMVAGLGVLLLDGKSRFSLVAPQAKASLGAPPNTFLDEIFRSDAVEKSIIQEIRAVFGFHFLLDPLTNGSTLAIRQAEQDPGELAKMFSEEAQKFFVKARSIQEASDGVQAYTGIMIAHFQPHIHTLMIDEPEAFLHPPLVRRLGSILSKGPEGRNRTMIAATHSPDFVMGCLSSGAKVNIIRVERRKGQSSAYLVDSEQLNMLTQRPLMRSGNVIAGLFHDGMVVTESDNDRAFYSEIYHRLKEENPDLPTLHFVNAQNKQTIREILGPMRKFGVPVVGIPDIDIVKEGGTVWTEWLKASNFPTPQHQGLGNDRREVKNAFDATSKDMKTDGGVEVLAGSDRQAAIDLFDRMADYGIFVVTRGELESWLPKLGGQLGKKDWVVNVLNKMGSDPNDPTYLKPGTTDVWEFLRRIAQWISNPHRKGMPLKIEQNQ